MYKWRLIVDPDLPGVENMARDEALLSEIEGGSADMPVLRLYGWAEPTISIGYAQGAASIAGAGLPVVRRITGGRAVIHGNEVTYSITAPSSHPVFSGGIRGSYNIISGCIVSALKDIGVRASLSRSQGRQQDAPNNEACFHAPSRSEVLVEGRKLVGSAQRRFKRAFLQHGSILFAIDRPAHERVFGPGVVEKMACLSSVSAAGREEFIAALVSAFSAGLEADFEKCSFSASELRASSRLMQGRYSSAGWNQERTGFGARGLAL